MNIRTAVDKLIKIEKERYRKPKIVLTFTLDGITDSDDVIIVYMNIGI